MNEDYLGRKDGYPIKDRVELLSGKILPAVWKVARPHFTIENLLRLKRRAQWGVMLIFLELRGGIILEANIGGRRNIVITKNYTLVMLPIRQQWPGLNHSGKNLIW